MSESPRPGGTPVWDRGRVGRFALGLWEYVRTAWWGLVSAHVSERRPLAIAQAVILRGDARPEVLLSIRRDLFGWELPGGTVEPGERPLETVVREVEEETGLRVEPVRHVGDWVRTGFRPHTAHVFVCRVVSGALAPSHETPRLGWFEAAAPPETLFAWYREPLSRALAPDSVPVEQRERQGLRAIWQAMRIDLSMRWRGLPHAEALAAAGPAAPRAPDGVGDVSERRR